MIVDDFELHCAANAVAPSVPLTIRRIPDDIRDSINPGAALMMRSPAGMEIRFVARRAEVTLSSATDDDPTWTTPFWEARAWVYLGRLRYGDSYLLGPTPTRIRLEYPPHLSRLTGAAGVAQDFSPQVWRVVLGFGPTTVHSVSGDGLRPPRTDELPRVRYCAYGTSITNGVAATTPMLSYPAQVAEQLGLDYMNMGVAGSALCEPELATYLNDCDEWELITCEASTNMLLAGYPLSEYRRQIHDFLSILARGNRRRQVVLVTPLPYFGDLGLDISEVGIALPDPPPQLDAPLSSYRAAMAEMIQEDALPNLHLVDGLDLLPLSFAGFTTDLAHPADEAMTTIARRLADRLRPIVAAATHTSAP